MPVLTLVISYLTSACGIFFKLWNNEGFASQSPCLHSFVLFLLFSGSRGIREELASTCRYLYSGVLYSETSQL